MSHWERKGESSEWYTPAFVFEALGCTFDTDVAAPYGGAPHVPCRQYIWRDSLAAQWSSASLFEVDGDILRPWTKSVLDAGALSPETPFILVPDSLARAGLRLGAASAWQTTTCEAEGSENTSLGRGEPQKPSNKPALYVGKHGRQTSATIPQSRLSKTASHRDAGSATAQSHESECSDCEKTRLSWSKQESWLTYEVQWAGSGSENTAGFITLRAASATFPIHSSGPGQIGRTSSVCSAAAAPTAAIPVHSTKIILSRSPILDVLEQSEETSFQHAPAATYLKGGPIRLPGLQTKLRSHGFSESLTCIGVVSRPLIWANPPFGGRNGLAPWLDKFFVHGNGIALTPDRTSAPWFQDAWDKADCVVFTPKIRFLRPDGSEGASPSNGTALWASGERADGILRAAAPRLGILADPVRRAA